MKGIHDVPARLWKIKLLTRILPVNFRDAYPEDDDYNSGTLDKHSG